MLYHKRSKRKQAIYQAIQKYGINNFQFDILYQSLDKWHTLNIMEPHFISEYNTFVDSHHTAGYNLTRGGSHKDTSHAAQTKLLISEASKRQWQNPEYRNKMVQCNKHKWNDPEFLLRKARYYEVTTPSGEVIVTKNLAQICRDFNLDTGSMCSVSNGIRSHHKHFTCKILTT
jgi:hypothetical protein